MIFSFKFFQIFITINLKMDGALNYFSDLFQLNKQLPSKNVIDKATLLEKRKKYIG